MVSIPALTNSFSIRDLASAEKSESVRAFNLFTEWASRPSRKEVLTGKGRHMGRIFSENFTFLWKGTLFICSPPTPLLLPKHTSRIAMAKSLLVTALVVVPPIKGTFGVFLVSGDLGFY